MDWLLDDSWSELEEYRIRSSPANLYIWYIYGRRSKRRVHLEKYSTIDERSSFSKGDKKHLPTLSITIYSGISIYQNKWKGT